MQKWFIEFWPWIVATASLGSVVAAVAATVHALQWKRDSRAVIGWVGLVWLAPMLGSLAYLCFGVNRIQRKAVSLERRRVWDTSGESQGTPQKSELHERLAVKDPSLVGLEILGYRLTGKPILPGNRIDPLIDGDEAYPAMLACIEKAERSITLLSYIFDSDRAGERFLEALVQAHERGVQVRVLIDHVGSRYSRINMVKQLRESNLQAASFLPTSVPRLFKYANLRNHRKILVVDGRVGFTGGTNIREGHWFALNPASPAHCLHFRCEGPVVQELQETFSVDWAFASGESLHGDLWFPALRHAGRIWARGISHGPDEDFEKMSDTILGALSVARTRVRIVTPYFLPHVALIHALNVAAMRGVEVDIVLPSKSNILLVDWAASAQNWQVLDKGCRIHLTPRPFDHTKLMVVDDVWTLLGSTNWDQRSLRLNFEFNVECYDDGLARQLNALIDEKIAHSHQVTLEELGQRSFPIRIRDGLARLLTPYL